MAGVYSAYGRKKNREKRPLRETGDLRGANET